MMYSTRHKLQGTSDTVMSTVLGVNKGLSQHDHIVRSAANTSPEQHRVTLQVGQTAHYRLLNLHDPPDQLLKLLALQHS